jgi:hypothetical protein
MDAALQDAPLFEGEGWTLTASGLEHDNGYFIARDEIGARRDDGLWVWPLQMAEKLWCAQRPFSEAFRRALLAFAIEPDGDLARSLAMLRDTRRHGAGAAAQDFVPIGAYADAISATARPSYEVELEAARDEELAPRRAA